MRGIMRESWAGNGQRQGWGSLWRGWVGLGLSLCLWGCGSKMAKPKPPEPSLQLLAWPQMALKPQPVFFKARIKNPEAWAEECPALEWHFGDGCRELVQDWSCPLLPRVLEKQHTYRSFGSFKPALYLKSQKTGKILDWADVRVDFPWPDGEGGGQ